MAWFYFECRVRSFRFNVYIEKEKNDLKLAPILEPESNFQMGVGAVVIAKVNKA